MDDEHACRIEIKTSQLKFSYRIICRCGFTGTWRDSREQVLEDRLAHKRSLDIPNWPASS
jgi:hypothetical protein